VFCRKGKLNADMTVEPTAAWSAPDGCATGVAPQNPILAEALPPT
jgi:hypothetical protein